MIYLVTHDANQMIKIAPTALRGIVSSAAAIAFTLGPLIVALIVKGTGEGTTRWAYRGVFVAQYGVLAIAAVGLPFMPEYEYLSQLDDRMLIE